MPILYGLIQESSRRCDAVTHSQAKPVPVSPVLDTVVKGSAVRQGEPEGIAETVQEPAPVSQPDAQDMETDTLQPMPLSGEEVVPGSSVTQVDSLGADSK